MFLQLVLCYIILITSVMDAKSINMEVKAGRKAIIAAYESILEENDELTCNNKLKDFKEKIDEYMGIEKKYRNKTLILNEDLCNLIITTACNTTIKESLNKTQDLNEKIDRCRDDKIGRIQSLTTADVRNNTNVNGSEPSIVKMLFHPDYRMRPVLFNSEAEATITELNECLMNVTPQLNPTFQQFVLNKIEPVPTPSHPSSPAVQSFSGNTWIYILVAVLIVIGASAAAVIVFIDKTKQQARKEDTRKYELKAIDNLPKDIKV